MKIALANHNPSRLSIQFSFSKVFPSDASIFSVSTHTSCYRGTFSYARGNVRLHYDFREQLETHSFTDHIFCPFDLGNTQRQHLHIELPSDIIVNGYSRSGITICEGIELLRAIRQLHWNRLKQTTARVCSQCRSRGTIRGLMLVHYLLISLMQMIVLLGITISTTSSFWEALIRKKRPFKQRKHSLTYLAESIFWSADILKAGQFQISWSPSFNGHLPLDKSVLFTTSVVNAIVSGLSLNFFQRLFKIASSIYLGFRQCFSTKRRRCLVLKLESYL